MEHLIYLQRSGTWGFPLIFSEYNQLLDSQRETISVQCVPQPILANLEREHHFSQPYFLL